MKNLITIILLGLLISCSKKEDPTPKPVDNKPITTVSGVNQDSLTILNFPLLKGAYVNNVKDTLFLSKITDTSVFIRYRYITAVPTVNKTDTATINIRKATLRKWQNTYTITYPYSKGFIARDFSASDYNVRIMSYQIEGNSATQLLMVSYNGNY